MSFGTIVINAETALAQAAFERLDLSISRVIQRTGKGKQALTGYEKVTVKATKQVKRLRDANGRFVAGMGAVDKKAKGVMGSIGGLVGKLGLLAGGLGLGATAVDFVTTFAGFEQALANLSAITGAAGADLAFLETAARNMGASTQFAASQAAEGMRLIASNKPALLDNLEALKGVTHQALTLAGAAGIDLPDAASITTEALNQFGAAADQAGRFVNVMAAGSRYGASSVMETGEALNYAGAVAANVGLSFESTNAAIQVMAASGIKASAAGTGLRAVLAQLEQAGESQFQPSVVGMSAALRNLQAENMTTADVFKRFGRIAAPAALALVKNADAFDTITGKVTNTNTAMDQQATQLNTLQGDGKALRSAFEELQIAMVGAFGDDLRTAVQAATDGVRALAGTSDAVVEGWNFAKVAGVQIFGFIGAEIMDLVGLALHFGAEWSGVWQVMVDGVLKALSVMAAGYQKWFEVLNLDGLAQVAGDAFAALDTMAAAVDGRIGEVMQDAAKDAAKASGVIREHTDTTVKLLIRGYVDATSAVNETSQAQDEHAVALEDVSDALEGVGQSAAGAVGGLEQTKDAVGDLLTRFQAQAAALENSITHFGEAEAVTQAYAQIVNEGLDLESDRAAALLAAAQQVTEYEAALARLQSREQSRNDTTDDYEHELETWQNLRQEMHLTANERERLAVLRRFEGLVTESELLSLEALITKVQEERDAVQGATQALNAHQNALQDMLGVVSSGLEGFLKDWVTDGKADIDGLLDHLKQGFIQTVLDLAKQKLLVPIQAAITGGAGGVAGGGLVGNLMNRLGGLFQNQQGETGLLNGYGGAAVGGLGAGLLASSVFGHGSTGSQIAGTLGGIGAGATSGAALGPVGMVIGAIAGAITSGVFSGSDWAVVGETIAGRVAGGAVAHAEQLTTERRDKPFFGGGERRTTADVVHGASLGFLMDQWDSVFQTLSDQSDILGDWASEYGSRLELFQANFDVDLTGLDAAGVEAALKTELARLADIMAAGVLPFGGVLKQAGETMAGTLERVARAVDVTQRSFDGLDWSLDGLVTADFVEGIRLGIEDSLRATLAAQRDAVVLTFDDEAGTIADYRNGTHEDTNQIDALNERIAAVSVTTHEAMNTALLAYQADLAEAVGGADSLAVLFDTYAATFRSGEVVIDQALTSAVLNQQAAADSALAELGATREGFQAAFDTARSGGLAPEDLAAWLEAAATLAQLGQLEQQLAGVRGDAVDVISLTVDQLAALQEYRVAWVDGLRHMGVELGVNSAAVDQWVLNLSASVGGLEALSSQTAFFFEHFYTQEERAQAAAQAAAEAVAGFGFAMEDLTGGGLRALFEQAVNTGDEALAALILQVAPHVAAWETAMESLSNSLDGVAGATRQARDGLADMGGRVLEGARAFDRAGAVADETFTRLVSRIRSVSNNINQTISTIRGGTGGAAPTADIGALYGSLGVGSIDDQLDTIDQLQAAIGQRYAAEVAAIEAAAQAQADAARRAAEARQARQRAEHDAAVALFQVQMDHYQAMMGYAGDLRGYLDGLQSGGLGGLSEAERFNLLQAQFQAAVDAGMSGEGSAGDITGVMDQMLQMAQGLYGNTDFYQQLLADSTAQVEAVITALESTERPDDPGVLHLPPIATHTGMTAQHTAAISAAQTAALRELEALQLLTEELEAQAAEEAEARYQAETDHRNKMGDLAVNSDKTLIHIHNAALDTLGQIGLVGGVLHVMASDLKAVKRELVESDLVAQMGRSVEDGVMRGFSRATPSLASALKRGARQGIEGVTLNVKIDMPEREPELEPDPSGESDDLGDVVALIEGIS